MALQDLLLNLGVSADNKALGKVSDNLSNVNKAAVLAAAGVAALAAGIGAAIKSSLNTARIADEIDKVSKSVGISTDALQELRFAGGLAGLGSSELSKGLQNLQKRLLDAGRGSATSIELFERLGVSIRDSNGELRDVESVLADVADGYVGLNSATERSAIAQELLGRAGKKAGALLETGSQGIAAARAEARSLGGILGEELINNSTSLNDNISRLKFVFTGFTNVIAGVVVPILDTVVSTFITVSKAIRESAVASIALKTAATLLGTFLTLFAVSQIPAAVVALKALIISMGTAIVSFVTAGVSAAAAGAAAAAAWLIAAAPIIAVIALVTAVIAIFVDLFRVLTGEQSVILDLADSFSEWLDSSTSGFAEFLRSVRKVFRAIVDGAVVVIQKGASIVQWIRSLPGLVLSAISGVGAAIAGIADKMLNVFTGAIDRIRQRIAGLVSDFTDALGLTDQEGIDNAANNVGRSQRAGAARRRAENQRRQQAIQQLASEGFGTFTPGQGLQLRDGVTQAEATRRLEQIQNNTNNVSVTVDASNADNPRAVGTAVGNSVRDALNLRQVNASFNTEGA